MNWKTDIIDGKTTNFIYVSVVRILRLFCWVAHYAIGMLVGVNIFARNYERTIILSKQQAREHRMFYKERRLKRRKKGDN